jgi:hypothetical protein
VRADAHTITIIETFDRTATDVRPFAFDSFAAELGGWRAYLAAVSA